MAAKKKQQKSALSLMQRLAELEEKFIRENPEVRKLRAELMCLIEAEGIDRRHDHMVAALTQVHAQLRSDGRPARYMPVFDDAEGRN